MRDWLGRRHEAYRVKSVESGYSLRKRSMGEALVMFSGRTLFWSQGHCLMCLMFPGVEVSLGVGVEVA